MMSPRVAENSQRRGPRICRLARRGACDPPGYQPSRD